MIAQPGRAASAPHLARGFAGLFVYSRRAIELAWTTSRGLTLATGLLTLFSGALPAAIAYVSALIVDAVVAATNAGTATREAASLHALTLVAADGLLVAALAGANRGVSFCQTLLRAQVGARVNVMILEKALTLEVTHFENSEFYDKLTRARKDASSRPLSLVMRTFGLGQNVVSLASYGLLLSKFSPWAVSLFIVAGFPAFIAEARFARDNFQLVLRHSPLTRMLLYLEAVLAREDHAKEVKLFGLGPLLLGRYRDIHRKLYDESRSIAIHRDAWGFVLGLLGTAMLYCAYAWVALAAISARITLGQMTMYLAAFRQGQGGISSILSAIGGMYEDNLYLSTLYDYLKTPVEKQTGSSARGPQPNDGIRFEHVTFTYPGAGRPTLVDVDLHIRPGESLALVGENGSGKTTLIKLLTRLYQPDTGRILLDGQDLRDWEATALHARIGVIFQDFTRYQLLVGENIGVGDVAHFSDEARWRIASQQGMAAPIVENLPHGYHTPLGKWFDDGHELSGGQWQKVALSRAFMRSRANILVLDEPTASIDARAEATIFEHFRTLSRGRIAILISHRFSTVRMADHIVVLQGGRIIERGSHDELMQLNDRYAHLFSLQAKGYR
jgi:ATP-binding cassette, subfamily B, bacterial